ncbi:MAG: hypothetical protein A2754_02170 [Candidatus Magasanikbacteria bacterium RIFCSPHIGHO2_01_FULL_47_8]|uniref:Pseudouridine synthase n=1 Tax=Candidatus Magasanikbacteria bacterium RIFCSPHIGHO2_01_FULL_47_8 TaxID=1798673 RepID=A0A1F6MEY5_9BACT|nr:MAG: hypothetical protein A2754_02170 [Candidatus Magasanikbacteria bacterium RIFCSPHIGHO2_01_FULL_47_8]
MPKPKTITVSKEAHNQRLDTFLSTELSLSRSQVQKMIESKQITVNGKPPKKAGGQVKEGNVIVISSHSEKSLSKKTTDRDPLMKDRETSSARASLGMTRMLTPTIIAETPDYIVIEKPTGILTHPTMAEEENTVANFIVEKYPEIKKVGDDPIRPGIVHRLDKEASGLLVIARTQKMFNHLKEQFKNRTIEKEYLALAHGKVAKDWDEINFPITRSDTADRMAARPLSVIPAKAGIQDVDSRFHGNDNGEKSAKTEFWIEQRFVNFTLLRVKIHTGRMHQIRVHLFAYNHPLVGDPLYIQKKRKHMWDEKLGRLFLHAVKLSFLDLAGERQTFESALPQELTEFLKQLS